MKIKLPEPDSKLSRNCIASKVDQLNLVLIALEMLDDFRYRPEPTKPDCVKNWEEEVNSFEYKKLSLEKKSDSLQKIMKNKVFYAYKKSLKEIQFLNESNKAYLIHMMETLADKGMVEEMEKVNKVLNKFYDEKEYRDWHK